MQLAMQTIGEYEVICAEPIDDVHSLVPVFRKPSGHYGFVILICEMPTLLSCFRNIFTNSVVTRGQRG